jgi:hypothetical protein
MLQDRSLELSELRPRLHPQLVDQSAAALVVHIQRSGLTSAAIQRQHELRTHALAERFLPHQHLELRDDLVVAADRKIRIDPLLKRSEAQLAQSAKLARDVDNVTEFRERVFSPQRERTL